MKRYFLLLVLLPLMYVGSYGYYWWKKGEKVAAAGAFIATVLPLIFAFMMFLIE